VMLRLQNCSGCRTTTFRPSFVKMYPLFMARNQVRGVEKNPAFTGQAGKFLNLSDRRLDLYWDDNGNGR